MTRARLRRQDGLTLIEVMGAVAIVGIVFLMLSTIAFNGIRSEGRALRLLEASLVADEMLVDLETLAQLGLPLELETDGYGDLDGDGEPEYVAFLEIEPFDPGTALVPADDRVAAAPFVDPRKPAPAAAAPNPLAMLQIQIDVYQPDELELDEGAGSPLASRTSYLIDPETIAAIPGAPEPGAPASGDAANAAGAGGDDGGDDPRFDANEDVFR